MTSKWAGASLTVWAGLAIIGLGVVSAITTPEPEDVGQAAIEAIEVAGGEVPDGLTAESFGEQIVDSGGAIGEAVRTQNWKGVATSVLGLLVIVFRRLASTFIYLLPGWLRAARGSGPLLLIVASSPWLAMAAPLSGCAASSQLCEDDAATSDVNEGAIRTEIKPTPPSHVRAWCHGDDGEPRVSLEADGEAALDVTCPEGTVLGPEPGTVRAGPDGETTGRLGCIPVEGDGPGET